MDDKEDFIFDHPYGDEDHKEFVRKWVTKLYGEEHVKDIDWDNCVIVDD